MHDYDGYLSFIAAQCVKFETVCLVLGNHEFYGTSRENGLMLAHRLENDARTRGRLKVLDRDRLDVGHSLCILGCTLQSHIQPVNRMEIERRVKDFQRIHNWTVDQHNEEHEKDLDWLHTSIASIKAESKNTGIRKRIVVITHHAPLRTGTSQPKDEDSTLTDAFATDLIGVNEQLRGVTWWVFGHTHFTTRLHQHGIKLVSNQRGYVLGGEVQTSRGVNESVRQHVGNWLKSDRHKFDIGKCITVKK